MRFDLHLRDQVRRQIADLATTMKDWEANPRLSPTDEQQIREHLLIFAHCRERPDLRIAGVDGSGDYPALSYADAFVYFSVAQGAVYAADAGCGLREVAPTPETVFHFTWLPGNEAENRASLDQAFGSLAGLPLLDCIQQSDYRELKARHSRAATTPTELLEQLIRPHAVLRLDLDRVFWEQRIQGRDEEETRAHERRLFEDLDYTGHDQRCYGYPYPIKAGHDRASLTQPERVALRKMIVDAAVRAGLKRNLFRDAAQATGHG